MSLVLDGSAALAWCFEDEATPAIEALFERIADHGAMVPGLWRLEVANGLRSAIRRGRLDVNRRDRILAELDALDVHADPDTDRQAWSHTLRLADRFNLTPYDASYLELALRAGLPLASLDRDLRRAAELAGVEVLGV